ncbi:MAG TPA: hypothetical protein PKX46_00050 [Clostridia bacterium]|nr:hypothetical protein [Clostridia bacterium]
MSMLDLLLGAGDKLTERPEETLEVSRISKICGEPFIVRIKALSFKELDSMPSGPDRMKHIIVAGVIDPDLTSEALRKKYTPDNRKTPLTPVEVVEKILQPGEVVNLYSAITELSGFGDDAVAKIEKN